MSNTPHELAQEFPEHAAAIQQLRGADAHFAQLVDDYHAVNREIHRAETLIQPVTPEHEAELRRKRMLLKDEIWRRLKAA
jgi:uncharacterized protein YdcH (DUF465 family)